MYEKLTAVRTCCKPNFETPLKTTRGELLLSKLLAGYVPKALAAEAEGDLSV
jgi:hypothetical protein